MDLVAFLNSFREEPYVLLFGQGFDVDAPGCRGVIDLPWGTGHKVRSPAVLDGLSYDYVLVAVKSSATAQEIIGQCQ